MLVTTYRAVRWRDLRCVEVARRRVLRTRVAGGAPSTVLRRRHDARLGIALHAYPRSAGRHGTHGTGII